VRVSKFLHLHKEVRHDGPLGVCLDDLASRLTGTDASLASSLSDILTAALQELIEAELTACIGAEPGERSLTRTAQRNGHRPKLLSTPAGDLEVGTPKLRTGSFVLELLERRRRIDKALWAVIMTAYITGNSTRKVDDLVKALGCDTGISKSSVSRILQRHRRRRHRAAYPPAGSPAVRVRLARRHLRPRARGRPGRVQSGRDRHGLRADGHREVLGVDVGDSENETSWTEFLRDLKDRGLVGVKLVISDAHAGCVPRSDECSRARSTGKRSATTAAD